MSTHQTNLKHSMEEDMKTKQTFFRAVGLLCLLALLAACGATPTPAPQFVEQPPYTGDCKQRPSGSVCLGFEDGYVWLVYDSIAGWAYGDPWQGKQVQIAQGFKADYHHVLGTNLVMAVAK